MLIEPLEKGRDGRAKSLQSGDLLRPRGSVGLDEQAQALGPPLGLKLAVANVLGHQRPRRGRQLCAVARAVEILPGVIRHHVPVGRGLRSVEAIVLDPDTPLFGVRMVAALPRSGQI